MMRLRFEAEVGEYWAGRDRFIRALSDRFEELDPELADQLEKALPEHRPNLKWRMLRDLKSEATALYRRTVEQMLAEIGKVLDQSVQLAKADADAEPPEYKSPEEQEMDAEYDAETGEPLEEAEEDEEPEPGSEDPGEEALEESVRKAGPYIGPRGGKWADAAHTIPWKPEVTAARRSRQEAGGAGFSIEAGLPEGTRGRIHAVLADLTSRYPELAGLRVQFADWMVGQDVLASKSRTSVTLNPDYWGDEAKLEAVLGPWKGLRVGATVEGTVVHECGHILDGIARETLGWDKYKALVQEYAPDLYTGRGLGMEAASVYGQENDAEFLAEAFTAHYFGEATMGQWSADSLRVSSGIWTSLISAMRGVA